MIDPPYILESHATLVAQIHLRVPRSEIRVMMGPGMREVQSTVRRQGITPLGPLFCQHYGVDPEVYEFDICVPVAEPVEAEGRVVPAGKPARRVVRTIYHGGYEGLAKAWGELDRWMAENGYAGAPDFWEVYLKGPADDPDPATWTTELSRPLA